MVKATSVFLGISLLCNSVEAKTWKDSAELAATVAKEKYLGRIELACERWKCDNEFSSDFFISVMITENQKLDEQFISGSGAVGLMQVKPSTAKEVGLSGNLHKAYNNIWSSVGYFVSLKQRYKMRTLNQVILAYKEGPTRAKKMLKSGYVPEQHLYVQRVRYLMGIL